MSDFINVFFKGKQQLPPKAQATLEKVGNQTILEMTIYRTPLNDAFTKLGNLLTSNKLQERMKQLKYDDLFHLYMIIKTTTGQNILLEKNEIINISLKIPKATNKTEMLQVLDIPPALSIDTFVENGRIHLGDRKFYIYDAFTQNCQYFINGLLEGNSMGNEQIYNFVRQDIKFLFKRFKNIKTATKGLLWIARKGQQLIQGGDIHKKDTWIEHLKEYAKRNNMTYKEAMKCDKCKNEWKDKKIT